MTSTQQNSLAWTLIGVVTATLLWLLAPVLSPFVIAWVLAYATEPLVQAMARRRVPRSLAAVLIEVLCIAIAVALVLLVWPIINNQIPKLRVQLPALIEQGASALAPQLAGWGIDIPHTAQDLKALVLHATNAQVSGLGATLLNSARWGGSLALAVIGHLVLVPLVWFYLLLDWPVLGSKFSALVPPRHRELTQELAHDCNRMLGQYLRGQLMVMAVLALYYSAGLTLFGFDLAWPIGIFTGLVYFIPYVGFGLGLLMALLAGMLQFLPTHAASHALVAVTVVFGGGQILEGFFLTPRLVGQRIGLHPVAVIFALLAFGQLLGFVGVLLALPISAVGMVIGRRALAAYRGSAFYLGRGEEGPL